MAKRSFILMMIFVSFSIFSYDGVTKATEYVEQVKDSEIDKTDDVLLADIPEATTDKIELAKENEVVVDKNESIVNNNTEEITVNETGKDKVESVEVKEEVKITDNSEDVIKLAPKEEKKLVDSTTDKIVEVATRNRGVVGNLIVFRPDEKKNIAPGLRYDKLNEKNKLSDYEMANFTPDTTSDFYNALPELKRNSENIVIPGNIKIRDTLGIVLFSKVEQSIKTLNVEDTIKNLEKLIYYNFSLAESNYYMGISYYKIRNYPMATKYLNQSILYSNYFDIKSKCYELLAEINYSIKNYQVAHDFYIQGISSSKTTSRDGDLYYRAGLSLVIIKKYEDAKALFMKAEANGNKLATINLKWLNDKITK